MTNEFACQWLGFVLMMGIAAIATLKIAHARLHLWPAKSDHSRK